jgi:hypothetical protein
VDVFVAALACDTEFTATSAIARTGIAARTEIFLIDWFIILEFPFLFDVSSIMVSLKHKGNKTTTNFFNVAWGFKKHFKKSKIHELWQLLYLNEQKYSQHLDQLLVPLK